MKSRWLPFALVCGLCACATWHGPGSDGGCSFEQTDEDDDTSSEGGQSSSSGGNNDASTPDAATTPGIDAGTVVGSDGGF